MSSKATTYQKQRRRRSQRAFEEAVTREQYMRNSQSQTPQYISTRQWRRARGAGTFGTEALQVGIR